MEKCKKYNLFFENIRLNKKTLTIAEAEQQASECVYNYGYRPKIIEDTQKSIETRKVTDS